jgi:hypothetical protein
MSYVTTFVLGLLIACSGDRGSVSANKPFFQAKLREFGYVVDGRVGEYSSVDFLSDNVLLVAINQRVFRNGEPLNTDLPPSTLVVFDLDQRREVRTAAIAVMKKREVVAPLASGMFLALSVKDVKVCSAELSCDQSYPTKGAVTQLDSDSLRSIGMKDGYVLRSENTSADGTRTLSTELRRSAWSKVTHPLAIDEPGPFDVRRVTVHDTASNATLIDFDYDPKNQLIDPVLSPDGKRLAVVRLGTLEVYELP